MLAAILGNYETKKMGNDWTLRILAATDHRLVFYAKKMGGYDMEVFPYKGISSIEMEQGDDGAPHPVLRVGQRGAPEVDRRGSDTPGFVNIVKERMSAEHAAPASVASGDAGVLPGDRRPWLENVKNSAVWDRGARARSGDRAQQPGDARVLARNASGCARLSGPITDRPSFGRCCLSVD